VRRLIIAAGGFLLCVQLYAQSVSLESPLNFPPYNFTTPQVDIQPVTGQIGHELNLHNQSGAITCYFDANGQFGGTCGISGAGLPSSWTLNGTTNAVVALPVSGQDAVPFAVQPNAAGGTADIFQAYGYGATPSNSCATNANCFFALQHNGNVYFKGSTAIYQDTANNTAAWIHLYGGSSPANAGPYLFGSASDGSHATYLYFDPTNAGQVSLETSVITGAATPANIACTAGNLKCAAQPAALHSTGNTALISTATLCGTGAGACGQAGQYLVSFNFVQGGTACGTPGTGGVTFLLTWTDASGTHSSVSLAMDDASAITSLSQTFHFQASNTAAWASGSFAIWSTGANPIQYATGYTACGVGTGTYELDAAVTRLQ
jgi:hypothetical protein